MNRRENLLKTLRHEPHDRLPAFTVIDNFNYPNQLPKVFDMEKIGGFADPEGLIELSAFYGMDTLIRITPSVVRTEYGPEVSVNKESLDNDSSITTTIWETSSGKIRSISELSKEANTLFIREFPVKKIKDYDALLSIINTMELYTNEKNILESKRILEILSNQGIAYAVCPSTPIMTLTRTWAGIEKLVYDLADERELVETVLDAMAENYYKQCELIAMNTPCEVLVFWDDANSLYISPDMFKRYSVPVMKRYAEIAHKYGKTIVCHTCGTINAFVELFLDTDVDAVDWVAPFPIGDIDPGNVQRIWGDKITMMLSTVPGIFTHGTPEQVEEHVHQLLKDLDINNNLIMMLTPPVGTPLENMKRAVQVLTRDYGVPINRSKLSGNILD